MGNSVGESPLDSAASSKRSYLLLGLVIAAIALILDQGVKTFVSANMELGDLIEVIPGFFSIHYILNPGAAFSMGENLTILFAILQAAVAVYVTYLLICKVKILSWAIALGALLGGVLGNLGDRIFREPYFGFGHVVDMFSVNHFAIFNVADSFIVCSMIAVAYLLIRGINFDGSIGDQPKATGKNDDAPTDPEA